MLEEANKWMEGNSLREITDKKIKDRVTLGAVAGAAGGIVGLAIDKITGAKSPGFLTSLTLSAMMGVGQTYMYSLTGKDQRPLKAIGFGLLAGHLVSSFGSHSKAEGTSLISSLANALVTSQVITAIGDESLLKPTNMVKELIPQSLGFTLKIDPQPQVH